MCLCAKLDSENSLLSDLKSKETLSAQCVTLHIIECSVKANTPHEAAFRDVRMWDVMVTYKADAIQNASSAICIIFNLIQRLCHGK